MKNVYLIIVFNPMVFPLFCAILNYYSIYYCNLLILITQIIFTQVVRVGTKKTAFANFTEIAKMLHRTPKHLLAFLFAELGTSGAIDGSNQLIMKGRFQQKHIENVLRR